MRGRTGLVALLATLSCLATVASGASAEVLTLPGGQRVGIQPLTAGSPAGVRGADSVFKNVDYNGGPVMASNTNYLIYWSPSGYGAYPGDYPSGINQYFSDLAHDSGGTGNVDSVAAQYTDSMGETAAYRSGFGGAALDTTPFDPNAPDGCGAGCVTDTQIQAEVARMIQLHGWPRDLSHEYFVLTPPGVYSCFDSNPADGCSPGSPHAVYCAYHGAGNDGQGDEFVYAVQPYVTGAAGCDSGHHPNGTSDGALDGGLTHEHIESVTDPYPGTGWMDWVNSQDGGEVGDKCAHIYGSPLGTAQDGSPYNQVVNGHFYLYQPEWSNQGHGCLQRLPALDPRPVAQFTSATGSGGLRLDASGSSAPGGVRSYHWQFEDGSYEDTVQPTISTTESGMVGLTVYAADGSSTGTSRVVKQGVDGPAPSFATSTRIAGAPMLFTDITDDTVSVDHWNFGDGSAVVDGQNKHATHTYSSPGTYDVTLGLTDAFGQTAYATQAITVLPGGSGSSGGGLGSGSSGGGLGSGSSGGGSQASSSSGVVTSGAAASTVGGGSGGSGAPGANATGSRAWLISAAAATAHGQRYLILNIARTGTVTVDGQRVRVRHAGRVSVRLHLNRRQRQRLRRAHHLRLSLRVAFAPDSGAAGQATVSITLRG